MQTNDSTTYNGWTNYATWRVNLEICDDLCASINGEQTFASRYDLKTWLKDTTEELVLGDADSDTFTAAYAAAFLSDVNWYEIADANADELLASEQDDEESDDE